MDDYLPFILSIVLAINLVLFIGQAAIVETSEELGVPSGEFFNSSGSLFCNIDSNKCTGETYVVNDTNPTGFLPEEPKTTADEGVFSAMFGSIKNFFSETLGLGYLLHILSAPKTFLDMLGLPNEVSFAIAAMWYIFSLLILLAFMWGR